MADPIRFEALWAKKESSYGVDAVPVATDAVRIKRRLFPEIKIRYVFPNRRDDIVSNSLIVPKPGVPVGRIVEFEIPWEIKGKGSAYAASTDIEGDPLLQACGMAVAVDATPSSEKLTYSLAESAHASCTLYGFAGGMRYIILGTRGNVSWPITAGEQGELVFMMKGLLVADPTTVAVPASTYDSSLAPAAVGCGFTLDPGSPYTPVFDKCAFDLGNEVDPVEDGNGTDGLNEIAIIARDNPRFTVTVRKELLSTYDPVALQKAVTSHLIDLTLGGTQYNRLKLDVNESYIGEAPQPYEYKKSAGWDLAFDVKQAVLVFD